MTVEFWKREGLRHLTPVGKDNPEGWDVWTFLGGLAKGSVLEIGCGTGRLARAFDPGQYLGVDVNPRAVEAARKFHPEYRFDLYDEQAGDTALLYTVLLHVSDDDVVEFVSGINAKRVIVAEVMGRKWRRAGNPPVFNREPKEYIDLFGGLVERHDKPYKHYKNTDITLLVFE